MAWRLFQVSATMSRTTPTVLFFIIFYLSVVGSPSTATGMSAPKSYGEETGCTRDKLKYCPYYETCCRISQYCSHRSRRCEPCYPTSLKKTELFKKCCEKGPHDVSWMAHETCPFACLDNFTLAELSACINSTDVTESNNTQVDVSDAIGRNIQDEQSESQHDLTPLYTTLMPTDTSTPGLGRHQGDSPVERENPILIFIAVIVSAILCLGIMLTLLTAFRGVSIKKERDTKVARSNTENNDSEDESDDGKHSEKERASNVKKRVKNNSNYEWIDEKDVESSTNKRKSMRNAAIEDMTESTRENISMENVSSDRIGNIHERDTRNGDCQDHEIRRGVFEWEVGMNRA